jgi:hypothetical protein
MATLDSTRSGAFRAASRLLDSAIEGAERGEFTHPSGTTFVPADIASSPRLKAYRRIGPVSIVDAEGNEVRLPTDRTREVVLVAALIGIAIWVFARRPRVSA